MTKERQAMLALEQASERRQRPSAPAPDLRPVGPGPRLGTQSGFTLVELMAGVVITLIVAAGAFAVLVSSEKAAAVNEQTAHMQQNGRIAMALISRDLKMAGFGFNGASGTVGDCVIGANAVPIVPLDNAPAGNDAGPDSVRMVVPTQISTLAAQAPPAPPANIPTLTLQPGSVAAIGFTGNNSISVNGVASGVIGLGGVAGDVLTLNTAIGAPATFPANTPVYWLQCITYAIGTTTAKCGTTNRCLLRGTRNAAGFPDINLDPNMIPIADGIDDLQIAYACDGCTGTAVPDGLIDDFDVDGAITQNDFVSNNTWAGAPVTPETIRLARVTVVARQLQPERGMGEPNQPGQNSNSGLFTVEDHNPANDAGFNASTYNQIRRRLLTRTVQVRNIGN